MQFQTVSGCQMARHELAYRGAVDFLFTCVNVNSGARSRVIRQHDSMVTVRRGASSEVF